MENLRDVFNNDTKRMGQELLDQITGYMPDIWYPLDLIREGADITLESGYGGGTALVQAVKHKSPVEIVKALLARPDVDVNTRDNNDVTALMWAAEQGREDIVELLLACPGIDVNTRDKWGNTALGRAAEKGRLGIVKRLLACPEIDVNVRDNLRRTVLMDAAIYGHLEVVQALLARPEIDVTVCDKYGRTALEDAEKHRYANIAALIAPVVRQQEKRQSEVAREAAEKGWMMATHKLVQDTDCRLGLRAQRLPLQPLRLRPRPVRPAG